MPLRMTTPHSLLLHAMFAVFWVLLLDALRLQALGCPPSPHQYGVSLAVWLLAPLIIRAFTLFKLQDYRGAG